MMQRFFTAALFTSLLSIPVFGITTIQTTSMPQSQSPAFKASLNCSVEGKYVGESYETETLVFKGKSLTENHVSWNFDIESKEGPLCPDGSSFKLAVRGGDVAKRENGSEIYVYPTQISPLIKGRRYSLLLRKQSVKDPRNQRQYTEWLPSDVDDAIQEK